MRPCLRFGRSALVLGLLCGLATFAFDGRKCSADTISMTIVANGTTIPVDPLIISGASSTIYGTVDLAKLNSELTAAGSAYQFSALGGSSNFSGSSTGGLLMLNGGIFIPTGGSGSTSLSITETQSGFASPNGPTGSLASSSTANFNAAGPGNSHLASSSFNNVSTPSYKLASTLPGPDPELGSGSAGLTMLSTPYTLTNGISFSLTPSGSSSPQDGFSVASFVSDAVVSPEPTSIAVMLSGAPALILVYRRRRKPRA